MLDFSLKPFSCVSVSQGFCGIYAITLQSQQKPLLCHCFSHFLHNIQLEVPEKDKKLIQRWGHGAAAVTVNSDCVEVILFGGFNKASSLIADTVAVRFGECFSGLHFECYICYTKVG